MGSSCIFCFKSDVKVGSRSGREGGIILRRFFTMVERYFEEKTGSSDRSKRKLIPGFVPVSEKLKVASCVECFTIVDLYCDTYHKMKCLELELDKLLNQLQTVMSCADKEPPKEDEIVGRSKAKKGKVEETMEFRRIFQKHCELGRLERFPKLRIDQKESVPKGGKSRRIRKPIPKSTSKAPGVTFKISSKPSSASGNRDIGPVPTEIPAMSGENIKLEVVPPESPNPDHFEDVWLPDVEMSPINDDDSIDVDWVIDYGRHEVSGAVDKVKKERTSNIILDSENDSDSDWASEDDEKKGREKKKTKPTPKRPGRVRNRGSKKLKPGPIECRKCSADPLPIFPSTDALQVHQNYLHSKGYVPLVKNDIIDTLHLTLENLRLQGVDTTIKRCSDRYPDCAKEFMLEEELTRHQKHHDTFACEPCGAVISDAVDYIILHEIKHLKKTNGQDGGLYTCGKCPAYATLLEGELINHCLEFHMGKPIIQAKCPICLQQFQYQDKVPFLHYINYHDLTRLEDPSSTGIHCLEEGCSAYFLTEDQLQHHWSSIHGKAPKSKLPKLDENKAQIMKAKRRRKYLKYQKRDCEHVCEFCPKKFRGIRELREHTWSKHATEKAGGDCGEIQLTEEGLTINEFAAESRQVCSICEKVLTSEWQLECHMKHHGEFKCDFCDEVKSLATELAIHETVHKIAPAEQDINTPAIGGSVNCARCNFTTTKRLDYIDHHLETHLGLWSDRKRCPICKKCPPSLLKSHRGKQSLKNWMVRHYMEYHDKADLDPGSIPKCNLCPAFFRIPVQLHDHSREVHGKHTVRECCDCGKFFPKADHLKSHRATVHKVDESTFQYVCSFPECGFKFERQIELDYHEHHAHNEKDVGIMMCPECGKKCLGKGQLAIHIRSHATIARKLAEKMAEKQAIKEKKVEVPMCDQCGKTFGNRRLLKAHVKRHLGQEEWRFVCPMCPKKCPDKTKLNEHIRMHTKDKPCVCEVCGAAYAYPRNLRLHRKRLHGETKVLPTA